MRLSTLLPLTLLLIARVSALTTSTPNAGLFNITSFLNIGSPHSIEARLSFALSSTCPVAPLSDVLCTCSQAIQPTIATTVGAVSCNDTSVFFTFEYSTLGNGYYLSITHLSKENRTVDTGLLYMGANVTTVVDESNPNGDFQMLGHEADFEVGYNRVDGCCYEGGLAV